VIRIELLAPAVAGATHRSAESLVASLSSALRGNIAFRPLPDVLQHPVPRFVSYVYGRFATPVPDEKVFIVRNDWNPGLKLSWEAWTSGTLSVRNSR
jgi:hypothetical protein